jgi:hypothetical protein
VKSARTSPNHSRTTPRAHMEMVPGRKKHDGGPRNPVRSIGGVRSRSTAHRRSSLTSLRETQRASPSRLRRTERVGRGLGILPVSSPPPPPEF